MHATTTMRRFWLRGALCLGWFAAMSSAAGATVPHAIRVMTFNLWHGGEAGNQPLEQTIKVIEAAKADLVGLQETNGNERPDGKRPDNAKVIAETLGWHFLDQGGGTAVISRFPIVENTPKKWGVRIEHPSGKAVWLFNVHFAHAPYQPYQLLKIPYADAPFIEGSEAAVSAAHKARGDEVTSMLAEVKSITDPSAVLFVTGDFNEPSSLDWTEDVFRAGRAPAAVAWPTTAAVYAEGFIDCYRAAHPKPLEHPGYTWTPTTKESDPQDHHDRIDFVMVRAEKTRIDETLVLGEHADRADIVVTPFPSDHRAVVTTITLE